MKKFGVLLKGFLMGSVELVPGVSSGTIAFITGIYTELLDSIKAINLSALRTLFTQGPKAFWTAINGSFLLSLVVGMVLAILTLARLIQYLMEQYPVLCWSFFFGLIVAASWYVAKEVKQWNFARVALFAVGAAFAYIVSTGTPAEIQLTPITLLLAGAIAISAMLLPGISGSFMLVLMGMYQPILQALNQFEIGILVYFIAGIAIGLLSFTHLLSWLLHHYAQPMQAFLTGVMLGALVKIWPWKEVVLTRVNSQGMEVPLLEHNILPSFGIEVIWALLAALVGVFLVFAFERYAQRAQID